MAELRFPARPDVAGRRLRVRAAGMAGAEVLRVLDALEAAGVRAGITGGWGIDALLRRETRAAWRRRPGCRSRSRRPGGRGREAAGICRDPRRTAGPGRRGERCRPDRPPPDRLGAVRGRRADRVGRGGVPATRRAASTPRGRSPDGRSAARRPSCSSRSTRTTSPATTIAGTWRRSPGSSGSRCPRPIEPDCSSGLQRRRKVEPSGPSTTSQPRSASSRRRSSARA